MKLKSRWGGAVLLTAFAALASPVRANPGGEAVAAGTASFDRSLPGRLVIRQGSDRLIVNWNDFSIGRGEVTRFIQPGARSVAFNRVTSGNLSRIYGNLEANGVVYLINPNGILIGPGGTINTRGFVGSTLDGSDAGFLSGARLSLSGSSRAPIVNEGSISALGGDVFLVAHTVENSGSISAARGTVGLAAASEVEIFPSGRERLSVVVGSTPGPEAETGIHNLGTIEAVAAELRAAGGNAYALAINNGGAIRATGVRREGGRVFLTSEGGDIDNSGVISAHTASGGGGRVRVAAGQNAGHPATVSSTGTIEARGLTPGTRGGRIEVTGDHVSLSGHARIDASGPAGGGRVLIGGGAHGAAADVPNASRTLVGSDVRILADALLQGHGGRVVIWSDEVTRFLGAISARGGPEGGRGGWVEVSGKTSLDYRGVADLRSPLGRAGSLLLDPKFILIENAGVTPVVPNGFGDDPAGTSTISPAALALALDLADVVLQASTDITFNDVVDASGNASIHNLTLQAGRSIIHNASLTLPGSYSATFNDGSATSLQRDAGAAAFVMNAATIAAPGGILIRGGSLAADTTGATSIGANTGAIQIDTLTTRGASAATGTAGRDGGEIRILNNAAAGRNIVINGGLDSRGSAAAGPGDLGGGRGGAITINASGALAIHGSGVNASGGDGVGGGAGGNAGAIQLSSGSALTAGAAIDSLGGAGSTRGQDGSLTLSADSLSLTAPVQLGHGSALLEPFTAGTAISLGAVALAAGGGPATLALTDAQLDLINADAITVGNAAAGNLTVVGAVTQPGKQLNLTSGGDIVFGNGNSVTSEGATLTAGGAIRSGTGVNVIASTLSAVAQTGIGLDTTVTTLARASVLGTGDIQITDTAGGLAVGNVNAGAGNVDLRVVNGSLTSAAVDGAADITGTRVTLTVTGSGSDIGGGPASPLEVNAVTLNAFTDGLAGEDISLLDTAGGVAAGTIDAGAGNLNLRVLNGSLTSGAQDFSADVAGRTVTLSVTGAGSKVGGGVDAPLEVGATTLNVATAGGVGDDIAVRTISGQVAAGLITAGSGNVDLIAEGGSLTSAAVDGVADIVGKVVTLTVTGDGSDLGVNAANRLEIDATRVNATTDLGVGDNIFLLDTAGGLAAGSVNAGAGNVDIRVVNGALTSAVVDGLADIRGNVVSVSATGAAGEIGGDNGRLELNATTLNASTAGGVANEIFLCDTGGGVALGLVNSGAAAADLLIISGNLTSATPQDNVADLVGGEVILTIDGATGRIGGTGASALEIDASHLVAHNYVGSRGGNVGQDINITDTAGGLVVDDVDAGLASVSLRVLNGDLRGAATDGFADVMGAAVNLTATGTGSVGVSRAAQVEVDATSLTATAGGSVFVRDTADGVTLRDITAGGTIQVRSAGTLTLGFGAAITPGRGRNVVLSAEGSLREAGIVNDGTSIFVTEGGQWFIYSTAPWYNSPSLVEAGGGGLFGNLKVDRTEFGMTFADSPPGAFPADGRNRMIFAVPERATPFPEAAKQSAALMPTPSFQDVGLSFSGYDPARFVVAGDLRMSTADIYEEERRLGKAARGVPGKAGPASPSPAR